ncbi:MAG: rRNA maturation RNase YbeY [Gammaproteobacteria bacterium]
MIHPVIQYICRSVPAPTEEQFRDWLVRVLGNPEEDVEIVIRIVDEAESEDLNRRFRQKDGPTNVLSFPFEKPEGVDCAILGDLVICAPVMEKEAAEQNKNIEDHWAHLVVHGTLHLLGYDHIEEAQAQVMEAREIEILHQLKINNPYLEVVKDE